MIMGASAHDNYLRDDEWVALLDRICAIIRSKTTEDVRLATLRTLRSCIPFQSAAFFLIDPNSLATVDCMIAQPVGHALLAEDFEPFMRDCRHSEREGSARPEPSRTHVFVAMPLAKGAPGKLAGAKMLSCAIEDEAGLLAWLAITRRNEQEQFTERDAFVVDVLQPYLGQTLGALFKSGHYTVLEASQLQKDHLLTKREVDVTRCVAYGMTTPEIAEKLGISINTAKKHLENIYRKIGVNNRMSLMKYAQRYFSSAH